MSWHRAKYLAYSKCINRGITIDKLDAGHEINSWLLCKPGFKSASNLEWRAIVDDEYMITFGKVPGYNVYFSEKYFSYLYLSERQIYVLRRIDNKNKKTL
jgi:hypothetical protein